MRKLFLVGALLISMQTPTAELWEVTYYCPCEKCCGVGGGRTFASGMPVCREVKGCNYGFAACNVLEFGTSVVIDNKEYIIVDRGSRRLFDNQEHIDIFMFNHKEALIMGKEYKPVMVLERK